MAGSSGENPYGSKSKTVKSRTAEHAFRSMTRDAADKNIVSPVLLSGPEQFLVRWAEDLLTELYVEQEAKTVDFVRLDGRETGADAILAHCETLPMMSEKRVVLVDGLPALAGEKSRHFPEADEAALIAYLSELPRETLLVFSAVQVDRRKKLFKALQTAGSVYDFTRLDEKELTGFLTKRFRKAGKSASPAVIREIFRMTGYFEKDSAYTLYQLDNDVKKIVAFTEGPEVHPADLALVMGSSVETGIFAMLDAVSRNRKGEAFELLHNMLSGGENAYRILALLSSQFEILLSVCELQQERKSQAEMKRILGIHEFRIKKAVEFSRRFTVPQLRRILHRAFEIDKNIKTGVLPDRMALEMFIARI